MARWSGKHIVFAMGMAAVLAGCRARPESPEGGEMSAETGPVRLEPGHPVSRTLSGGEAHSYLVALKAGQYVRLTAEQKGIDVVLRLLAPDGHELISVDSPNGAQGPERASEVAAATGDYRVEVRSDNAKDKPGQYEMRIDEFRPATERDRTRVAAERVFAEGEGLRRKKSWDKAMESYRRAQGLWRSLGDRGGEGQALYRIGTTYEAQGHGDQALDVLGQSIAAYQDARDLRGEATALNHRGILLESQGQTDRSLASYQQALDRFRKLDDLHGQASTLNNIGAASFLANRMRPAVEAYEEASDLWRRLGDMANLGKTLVNLGRVEVDEGRPEEARDALEGARRALGTNGKPDVLATDLSYLGELEQRQGRLAEARADLEKALALQRQIGDEQGQAVTQASLGTTLLKAGDLDGSWKTLSAALALFRKLGDRSGEGFVLSSLGRVSYARNQDRDAVAREREARAIFERVGERQGIATSRFGAARSLARLGDLAGARRELEPALDLVESLRDEAPGLNFRSTYFATKQPYWDLYVEILMQSHAEKLALQASDHRHARSLLDALGATHAAVESQADPALAAEIRDVEQKLQAAEEKRSALLAAGGDAAAVAAIEGEIRSLLTRQDVLRNQMRDRSPGAAGLTPPAPLSVDEMQKHLLDPDTLLLVYSLGDDRGFLWAVSQRSVTSYPLPGREQVETVARQLLEALPQASGEAQASGQRAAKALSDLVLAPAAERLASFHRLLVVGDGALQLVPFAVLPDPAPREKTAGRDRLLVEGHELVYLPSASVLAQLRRREPKARKPLEELKVAVIADPVFRADDPRVQGAQGARPPATVPAPLPAELSRSARDVGLGQLDRLPYTREEAESILEMAKKEKGAAFSALDFDATRDLLTSGRLRDYQVLHIATHGLLDSRQPELSGIAFSMVDPTGAPRDGFLRLHEVYNLDLGAGLVVLSACDTGAGKEVRGEGLMGITSGFLAAGVPQLVVSLWEVGDRSTAELMKRFYYQLLEGGHPSAEALRQAQLSMLAEPAWSQPRQWAGFVFLGDYGRRLDGGTIEETDSGGVVVVKKAGSDMPPPKVGPDHRRKKPAGPPPPTEEVPQ